MDLISCLNNDFCKTLCPKECLRMIEWFIENFIEQQYEKSVYFLLVI